MAIVSTAGIATTGARAGSADRAVGRWLLALSGMVLLQVMLGAVTRLTDSGLSIMEWRPIMGAIPPLSDAEWHRVFDIYRQIAEYQIVNAGMSLDAFKTIFWWEYLHRLWGRLIGVAFLVPFLWFWARGQLRGGKARRVFAIFILGALQGVMGWIMVMSGFADRTDVSQYRLVAHLMLALLIYGLLLWQALNLLQSSTFEVPGMQRDRLWRNGLIMTTLITLEIAIGGFVAGLDGGLIYNNFPMMGDRWIASDLFHLSPWWINFFENPAATQFLHRLMSGFVAIALISMAVRGRRAELPRALKRRFYYLPFGLLLQAALGIATLMLVVPLPLAVAHQAGAFLLITISLYVMHGLKARRA